MNKKEEKVVCAMKAYLKRFPILLAGFVVLLAAVVLLGGRALDLRRLESSDSTRKAERQVETATIKDGVQYVTSTMSSRQYDPITVQQGIPVKWSLTAPSGSLNGCNSTLVIPEYNLEVPLKAGENLIEFTPNQSGTIGFSCWMGMIRSSISVVEEDGTGKFS